MQRLRDELSAKRATLAAREQDLNALRGQLYSFEGRYIRQVGVLYRQLDEWERRTAELHAGKQPEAFDDLEEGADLPTELKPESQLLDLKAMFRELAKRIHPDFATDAPDEQRRTRLMAQANDALRRGDRQALQRMLNGLEPTHPTGRAEPIALALADAVAQVRQADLDIASAEADHHTLANSELAKLQQQSIDAALNGRDLLAEMAARVKGRIGIAMRQYELDLDRIKRPSKGMKVEDLVTAETTRTLRYDSKLRTWIR